MTTCFFLFTILTLVQPVSGQTKVLGDNVVERVVALVGDSVILMTELDEYLMTLEAGGWARPDDPEELLTAKTQVLDQLVNQQLILLEAIKDTLLTVSDDELEERVQEEVAGQIRQFGTTKQFQDVLAEQNMTVNQFREQRKNMIRRDLLQERYFAKTGTGGDDFIITEEEARSFFEENRS
ncbi:MAG: SurA N-terminal domain-containing protein, partial [bacterium]